ncbi:MAG: hypothetical protein HFF52_05190 [Lawsonibacter sp.]|nr:hypothetical protein [Lawsonibacter sp.]
MTGEIMALCRAMGARADQEELLLPLVQAVRARLARRLRPGVAPEECGQAFPLAAAMTAMEQLSGLTSAAEGGISSFTAGDLTIRRETEKSLSAQAEGLLAPWLGDREFHFQGVEG